MSTIKLYSSNLPSGKPWRLIPSKLFKIDNIYGYLNQFTPVVINNFQYIKNALEVSIKIAKTQEFGQPNALQGYKYLSIENNGEPIAYYFVKKASSRSQNTIQFDLVMDVLNTYNDGYDYVFKPNTKIIREHKDRYMQIHYTNCTIMYAIVSQSGTLREGDDVYLSSDDEIIFDGKLLSIDENTIVIQIPNPLDTQVYIDTIRRNLGLTFRVLKIGSSDDYCEFEPTSVQEFTFDEYVDQYRKIDAVAEGINPMLQCGNADGVKIESPKPLLAQNWYLLYRNANNPSPDELVNPVECYLIPQESIPVSTGSISNGRLTASSLEYGKSYFLPLFDMANQITLSNGVSWYWSTSGGWQFALVQKLTNGKLACFLGQIVQIDPLPGGAGIKYLDAYFEIDYITLNYLPQKYVVLESESVMGIDSNDLKTELQNASDYWDSEVSINYIDGVDTLDRADAKNIKLIKLPYTPYDFTIVNNKVDIVDTNWNYETITQSNGTQMKVLKLNNLNVKLHSNIPVNDSSKQPLYNLNVILNPSENDLRLNQDDSKMFNSEFYKPTYYYDSFSFVVALEKCNLTSYIDNDDYDVMNIRFDVTSTINSRFMFTFSNYYIRYGDQNYAKNLVIVRNNEEVLYNVPYINFIKTGYNYEVKNKNLQQVASWSGVGLSAVSIGASLLVPTVPLKVAGVVGSLVSMAVSVKGAITTSIQSEENLKAKLLQAENQTASVRGSDDVDLMSVYAENRLKYLIYQPMPNMKSLLNDLFFYAGYNSGRMGVPNHNTRINFDYLECEAILETNGGNIPQDIIDEIVNLYKTGVTFIHQTNRNTDKWDIEQKYENWERSLLED